MADRRTHIAAPYLAYNGATITCESHFADYNRIQDDINRWIDAGNSTMQKTCFQIASKRGRCDRFDRKMLNRQIGTTQRDRSLKHLRMSHQNRHELAMARAAFYLGHQCPDNHLRADACDVSRGDSDNRFRQRRGSHWFLIPANS